jgi:hypothetical protein
MRRLENAAMVIVALAVLAGAIAIVWAWPGAFPNCTSTDISEAQKIAVSELSDIVKWGLGLSVGIVGVYGSALLHLTVGPALTRFGRLLTLCAMECFAFSAYFALMWRDLLVQALYINCPKLIASQWMLRSFDCYTYFFLAGLAVVIVMIGAIAFGSPRGDKR